MPPPKRTRRQATGRRPAFDIAAAAADASSTTGQGTLDVSNSSQASGRARVVQGDDVPPIPKELRSAAPIAKEGHKVELVGVILAAAGLIIAGAIAWGTLSSDVRHIERDVVEVKAKTHQLILDSSKATVRLDEVERRTMKLEDLQKPTKK